MIKRSWRALASRLDLFVSHVLVMIDWLALEAIGQRRCCTLRPNFDPQDDLDNERPS